MEPISTIMAFAGRAAVAKLLQTGEYFDLTIRSKARVYNVHKAIVCP